LCRIYVNLATGEGSRHTTNKPDSCPSCVSFHEAKRREKKRGQRNTRAITPEGSLFILSNSTKLIFSTLCVVCDQCIHRNSYHCRTALFRDESRDALDTFQGSKRLSRTLEALLDVPELEAFNDSVRFTTRLIQPHHTVVS
jgi:hypothetical protein